MSICLSTKSIRKPSISYRSPFPNLGVVHSAHARWQSRSTIKANNGTVAFPVPSQLKVHSSQMLARLPLSSIIRSLILGTFFTSSFLSKPGIAILNAIARSRSIYLNPNRNPLVKAVVKPLIYDHFCAGTTKSEIQRTASKFKSIGYSGVILCYGKEFDPTQTHEDAGVAAGSVDPDLLHWRQGNLETLDMLKEGDVLGMKYTGAGKSVTDALINGTDPPKPFAEAMDAIVSRAIAQNTRIFVDAEQNEFQQAIDTWTIDLMRRHNQDGKVFIFNTVQAYLKHARQKFEHQLKLAHAEGWTLAIKLVRGAYIDSDPRQIVHDTKDQTDDCYNGIVRDALTGNMAGIAKSDFPRIDLFLAGHNLESVTKASVLIQELAAKGELKTVPEFGQLQGMCDELGCKILQGGEEATSTIDGSENHGVAPKVYKWSTWGTVQECMQYLVRRAVENRGATERMKDGMAELGKELRRRASDKIMGR